ncbi:unnamed protein product [Candida verbasci]|uniref:Major facilitator superfamily (MFS) profile domain-containing protein n=1 Tax=Candida verbasci TaxID=1227364 RepID=A0A9W4TY34_9ASCO|nr:unnamed protein product [Candida verbasci]
MSGKDLKDGAQVRPVLSFTEEVYNDKDLHVLTTILSPSGKEVKITNDVDQAMKFALAHKDDVTEIDDKTNSRLFKKINLYMLPIMMLSYSFQFMDKVSTSYSAILGLRTELNMEGDMYAWTTTCFYLGYLVFEFPTSYLLQRFPVAKTVSIFIIIWGMILALCSVPQYPGFIALRTILGILESSITPAFTIITSQWYKVEEQFMISSLWFASNGGGSILGSAIAYGLLKNDGSYSLPAWKLVFVVTGCLTIFLGFLILAHVPDQPTKAWFLTEQEKVLVVERIRSNQQGFGNPHFKKKQFIEAILDHRTWLFFLFALSSNIPNGAMTSFGSILLNEDFGYSTSDALLMGMPQGAVEIIGCPLFAYISTFFKSRLPMSIFITAVTVMAECLLAFAPQKEARLAGLYLYFLGPIGFICIISIIASNVAGHTKKVTVSSFMLIGYCVGNLIGPQTFIQAQAPSYSGGKVAIVVCGAFSLLVLILIYVSYFLENKKRDAKGFTDMSHIENYEFADLTDKENPNFRYAL